MTAKKLNYPCLFTKLSSRKKMNCTLKIIYCSDGWVIHVNLMMRHGDMIYMLYAIFDNLLVLWWQSKFIV